MINKTAYLNGLTKEKEIDLNMGSLRSNLNHMRSINRNEPELNPIEINKNKTKYLRNRRDVQIDVENEVLTQKIEKIIKSSRNSKYFSSNQKYSKSLNGFVKRTTQEKINQENLKFIIRLEESKPTYSTKKYRQEFEHIKKVEKQMSSADFYLMESPTFRKRKLNNTNGSFLSGRNSSFVSNSSYTGEKSELVKENIKLNDDKMWEIKIYREEKDIKITGQALDKKQNDNNFTQFKLIKMPINEANIFIKKHCQSKLNNLINHLTVDQTDGSLMLVVPQNTRLPSPSKLMNPEQKKNNQLKLSKLESLAGYQKKIPSRHIFNTAQSKPILFQTTLNESLIKDNKLQAKKQVNQLLLPSIELQKMSSVIQKDIQETGKQSIQQVPKKIDGKPEKINTKQSSIASIKSTNQNQKQPQTIKDNTKLIQKEIEKIQPEKEENQKVEEQNRVEQEVNELHPQKKISPQEQEKYEQQKFQQSMNNKPITEQKEQNINEKSIQKNSQPQEQGKQDQHLVEKIDKVKEEQEQVKPQQSQNQKDKIQELELHQNQIDNKNNQIQHQQAQSNPNSLNQTKQNQVLNVTDSNN